VGSTCFQVARSVRRVQEAYRR